MEQVARSMLNQLRVHKPKKSTTDGQDQDISISKPVITRSHSARTEAFRTKQLATPTTLMRQNKSCRYPTHQDHGQIIVNRGSSMNKSQGWDCGSSLYDSFELNSLNLQLDMAIKCSSSRRTGGLSIPPPLRPGPHSHINNNPISSHAVAKNNLLVPNKKSAGKVSKSLNKILRSVMFGSSKATTVNKTDTTTPISSYTKVKTSTSSDESSRPKGSLYIYDGSKSTRVLATIPEIDTMDIPKFSPDAATPTVVLRRAVSERFAAPSVSVS